MNEDEEMGSVSDDVTNEAEAASDSVFEDFISKFEAEEAAEETKSIVELEDSVETDEVVTETVTKEPEEDSRGIERVAAKEKEVRELIAKFEEDKKAFETERLKAPASGINKEDLVSQLTLYPEKVLAGLGLDTDTIMKTLLYNKLDDSNPAKGKLREQLKELETNRKFAALEDKLTAKENAIRWQEDYSNTLQGAEKYVEVLRAVEGEHVKTYPTVSEVAAVDSKYLHARIMREIEIDAAVRHARGETGEHIGHEEAVKRLEADLSVLSKLLRKTDSKDAATKKSTPVIGNNSTIKPPAPTKVVREKTIEDLENDMINKSVIEFHKHKSRGGYSG